MPQMENGRRSAWSNRTHPQEAVANPKFDEIEFLVGTPADIHPAQALQGASGSSAPTPMLRTGIISSRRQCGLKTAVLATGSASSVDDLHK